MLNRRILRIKAFKVLYGFAATGRPSLGEAEAQLDSSCEAVRDLYLYMLALISPLTKEAARRIEAARGRLLPSEEDLHPNEKFASNALAPLLDGNPELSRLLRMKSLYWDQYDIIVRGIYDRLTQKDYFSRYMASPRRSLKEDCALFTRVFEEELVDDTALDGLLEEKSVFWCDDLAYALTQCCRSLSDIAAGRPWSLPELYQSDIVRRMRPAADVQSDSDFVHKLLRNAYCGYEKYFALIRDNAVGWEADRLPASNTALIALGLAEAETFPDIPRNVSINEYVEISKYFCPPKSSSFVNGLLDKLIRENTNKQ